MAQPFKDLLDATAIGRLAAALAAARPGFARAAFVASAARGLGALELKDRVRHVAAALRDHLDPDYPTALAHLLDALPPPLSGDDAGGASFDLWPVCHFVEAYGLDHASLSLDAMPALTRRFSCEFAIRPYIARDPEAAFARLAAFAAHADPHVRRLASEGCRPRLPWGMRLKALIGQPAPILPVLEALKDDPSAYVRRSVSNNLNDIAKDHPDLVVATAARWARDAPEARRRLVRHALRTLVKQGRPDALAILGFAPAQIVLESFEIQGAPVALGSAIAFTIRLRSTAPAPQRLLVDYAIHHRRKDGTLSPKVFKWTTRSIGAGEAIAMTRRHAMKPITTRTYRPGEHRVEVLVNGASVGWRAFAFVG